MDNKPKYKIHGIERRKVKKDLGELKYFVKNFWFYHQLDKDMTSIYGGKEGYPMSDDKAEKMYSQTNEKIKVLEEELTVLY